MRKYSTRPSGEQWKYPAKFVPESPIRLFSLDLKSLAQSDKTEKNVVWRECRQYAQHISTPYPMKGDRIFRTKGNNRIWKFPFVLRKVAPDDLSRCTQWRISDLLIRVQESGNALVDWKVVKWDGENQIKGFRVNFGFAVSV